MSLPSAVLWDLDGTIAATEPHWIEAEHALVSAHGGTWHPDDSEHLIGKDLRYSAEYLQRVGGVTMPTEEIIHSLQDLVVERVQHEVPWRPGAVELIAALREAAVPQALVTMSWAKMALAIAAEFPDGTFASVVSGDRVERGKPFPDAYLLALQELGVAAEGATAIEDSPTGAAAAKASGVHVIVVPYLASIDRELYRIEESLTRLTPADLVMPTS